MAGDREEGPGVLWGWCRTISSLPGPCLDAIGLGTDRVRGVGPFFQIPCIQSVSACPPNVCWGGESDIERAPSPAAADSRAT